MKFFPLIASVIGLIPASLACAADASDTVVNIANAHPPVKYENVIETVIIENSPYEVPQPWAGNRLFPRTRTLDELRPIPTEFALDGREIYILADAYESFTAMLAKAHEDGIELLAESAYRSINYQNRIFARRMKEGHTFEEISRYVAPPGYSQHMLGTAIDFHPSDWSFADTPQFQWLQENGGDFGFEQTYSRNNRYNISWESWHWNYTGKEDEEETEVEEIGGEEIEGEEIGDKQAPDSTIEITGLTGSEEMEVQD